MNPALPIDAKATEHIFHRQGVGRSKHTDVAYLSMYWNFGSVQSRKGPNVRDGRAQSACSKLVTSPRRVRKRNQQHAKIQQVNIEIDVMRNALRKKAKTRRISWQKDIKAREHNRGRDIQHNETHTV